MRHNEPLQGCLQGRLVYGHPHLPLRVPSQPGRGTAGTDRQADSPGGGVRRGHVSVPVWDP